VPAIVRIMVIPFQKRSRPRTESSRSARVIEPAPRPLTAREISHRERMLSHLARLRAERRASA